MHVQVFSAGGKRGFTGTVAMKAHKKCMRPIWYIICTEIICISAIVRVADSARFVLAAINVVALVALTRWLYETGRIKVPPFFVKVLRKIGVILTVTISILYIVTMTVFAIHSAISSGDFLGVGLVVVSCAVVAVLWRMTRWRRWWVKFLKTFMPKDTIRHTYWKICEQYYWTFDYASNAQYGLRPSDGVFEGRARVWLVPSALEADAAAKLDAFEMMLAERDIKANCALIRIPGCVYADIVADTDYKTMSHTRQDAFRDTFRSLDGKNYRGEYYAKYQGELGTFFFACGQGGISRAIRTEPREEYYLDPDCGFRSDEAYYFIERGVDWTEGTFTLITEESFFDRWRKRVDYEDKDDAYSFFVNSSLMYFAAVSNGDVKEQDNCQWEIENVAKWLVTNDETDTMMELMNFREESAYWAVREFANVLPDEAFKTAKCIVENSGNTEIVSVTRKLLARWRQAESR